MNLFNEYKLHHIEKSECTLETYEVAVKQFYDFMNEQGFTSENEIIKNTDWSKAVMFRNMLIKKEYNPYSINNRISALRSFFKFLLLTRKVQENPFDSVENVGTNGVEQRSSYLTESEYKKLLQVIVTPNGKKQDKFYFTSKRDVFMVAMMITGGFRISEILSMQLDQINIEKKFVQVLGKGKKLRKIPLSGQVLKLMEDYLAVRNDVNPVDDTLFISIKGKPLSRQATNENIKKYTARAGIDKPITNHSLRHTALTSMAEKGMPVAKVSAVAGHTSIATTSRYVHASTEVDEEFLPDLGL